MATIQWLTNNKALEETQNLRFTSTGNKHFLTINRLGCDHMGLYTVVASNSYGQVMSSANVNVRTGNVKPRFNFILG